jgi:hypothetical protein
MNGGNLSVTLKNYSKAVPLEGKRYGTRDKRVGTSLNQYTFCNFSQRDSGSIPGDFMLGSSWTQDFSEFIQFSLLLTGHHFITPSLGP